MKNIISVPEENAARLLLEAYGYDSLSYFTLHKKKKYFFSSTGKSFLSYIIWRRIALVSGDPIGPKNDIPLLLQEFSYFVKGSHLTSCFVGIQQNSLSTLNKLHYKSVHVGEEAVIDLGTFEKDQLKKTVRRAERHITNLGITCAIFSRKNLPKKYLQQIEEISQEWVAYKGGRERGFSMTLGRIPDQPDTDCEFVLAIQEDKVLGYLTFVPIYASRSLSLDGMRRRQDAPNGLNEFLLLQAFEYYKQKQIKKMSLNFVAFYQKGILKNMHFYRLSKSIIFKTLTRLYDMKQLYAFNQKFQPEWQGRYVAFEMRRHIPYYILAIMKMELNL